MATWLEMSETKEPVKRSRFKGIRRNGKAEDAPQSEAKSSESKDGLREDRQRTVEAYYGVYPADAIARSRANNDLRHPPARLEATA